MTDPPGRDAPAERRLVIELGGLLEELGAMAVAAVELRQTVRVMRDRALQLADALDAIAADPYRVERDPLTAELELERLP